MKTFLTEDQWSNYVRDGYLKLGKLLAGDELKTLQDRIDDIMMGKACLDYSKIMMQLDSEDGAYGSAGPQTRGFKEPTLNYRKIQDLEYDPEFLRYMQRPIFQEICARTYGCHIPVGCFRAMFMNKPANRGTYLPWHQDRWNQLDRDPLVTIWTALDPATIENGCVYIIPGSHRFGVLNPAHSSGFLSEEMAKEQCEGKGIPVELEAGEVVLLHNWTLHSSDVNKSSTSRRAFSTCYLDARTHNARNGEHCGYNVLFGEGAMDADKLEAEAPSAPILEAAS